MTRRLALSLLAVAALAAPALSPATAGAAHLPPTVVDFERVPPPNLISDQYADVGVRFGEPEEFGLPPSRCGRPGSFSPGIAGRSAKLQCRDGSNEFGGFFSGAFEFEYTRRAVTFRLKWTGSSDTLRATVSFYAIGGRLLETQTVDLPPGAVVNVSSPPRNAPPRNSSDIAAVSISGVLPGGSYTATNPVLLDDISAPLDDIPPPPAFSLALGTPSASIFEGSTLAVPLSIRRFNGSAGPVTLSVGELPPGITGVQFDQNPVTGRNPVNMKISADSPLSGDRQISVSASAPAGVGTPVAATGIQTVHALPALALSGGPFPAVLVPGCATPVTGKVAVRGGYFGTVSFVPKVLSGPVSAGPSTSAYALGNGELPFSFTPTPTGDGAGVIRLDIRPNNATPFSIEYNTTTQRVRADSVSPSSFADTTTAIVVRGSFPEQCAVKFMDDLGREYPVFSRDTDGGQDRLYLHVPADGPVSAPKGLRVLGPDGKELTRTPALEATNYRNTSGLRQANSGDAAGASFFVWQDFVSTWGTDDAYACFIICVRDPKASDYYDQWTTEALAKKGLCFGYSVMSLRFRGANSVQQLPSTYEAGARRAYDLTRFSDEASLKAGIVQRQFTQHDRAFAKLTKDSFGLRGPEMRARAIATIQKNGGAIVVIRRGASGHAVVAYRVTDNPFGTFTLSVYDPNLPYSAGEETNAAFRQSILGQSKIVVQPDGSWLGTSLNWRGDRNDIAVVDQIPKNDPQLPSDFSLASLVTSAGGGGGGGARASAASAGEQASVTSIRSNGGEALGAGGVPKAGSGVSPQPSLTGSESVPGYELSPGRTYDFTVSGLGAGGYRLGDLGLGGNASVSGADTKPGQKDHVTFKPGQAQIGFAPGAESKGVTLDLTDEVSSRVTRTATILTDAQSGGSDLAKLASGALTLDHAGKASTATVTLGSVGEGLPGSVTTAPLKLAAGQRLELRPRSWGDLAGGVALTVRNAKGKVVRRGRAKLRATRAVAFTSLRAGAKGTAVTVSGRITRRGEAPVLVAQVELLRGGKVVGRRNASLRGAQVKAGRFSLKVKVPKLGKGARVRVNTTLLDEGAGLASVRRTVSARAG